MSFPPRPPMSMPGMPPMPPGMLPPGYGIPPMAPMMPIGVMPAPADFCIQIMPPGMTLGHIPDVRAMAANHRPPLPKRAVPPPILPGRKSLLDDELKIIPKGPTITVFVGNITDRASDNMIKHILQKCGSVVSWKRVQGASGKLQGRKAAFGFCEYADPESGLRSIRLLHDWEIGDKKLVVKVDAKTKTQLDEYKASKKAKDSKNEDLVDERTLHEDNIARATIDAILKEHEHELSRPLVSESPKKKLSKAQEALLKMSGQSNLDEMDLEEDKKSLIHREIGKFRDTMKKLEEEKERERERRERERERREKDRERDRDKDNRDNRREKDSNRLRNRSPERSRDRDKIVRENSRERSYERSRSRSRERERSKERERSRERTREVDYDKNKRDKDIEREREEEEEAYERKKLERKLREKEAAYQERLRNWEMRERKKLREYEKEKEKEEEKKVEEVKEAKRLKEFLEDYDDERDDPKYYKGSALSRRLKEREKEVDIDNRDRQREKEELEELKQKLMEEGHPDPSAEFERIKKEREEQFRPKIKVEQHHHQHHPDENKENKMKPVINSPAPEIEPPPVKARLRSAVDADDSNTQNSLSGFSDITTPKEEVKAKPIGFTGLKLGGSPNQQHGMQKRKKLTVGEVFNQDEDESTDAQAKKRKLVPLDYTDEEKKAVSQTSAAAAAAAAAANLNSANSASQEEKRKHIKNLIDKIPTEKDKLFDYSIDWSIVDSILMERRVKPWINKKIVEYIGEEEPTLVDFICSKVMAGSTPQCILDDVQMVLDEEAEVFVVKMWRLLIYEIEAKKLGLVK